MSGISEKTLTRYIMLLHQDADSPIIEGLPGIGLDGWTG
ncbi:hypothetical protein PC129_g19286 [Phytophthora cactorum]|uniref:Uncharacterized protein n=1 Tax=Phytophthora cactorum TaxID=29920 RepID=A0A8T1HCG3_9STRA|nr:hypothetical protein PC129_g19286 [Phytophthora cactorum]KAG4231521.1 hypothetical protein PC116_g20227 [Phytophthora cactorum]